MCGVAPATNSCFGRTSYAICALSLAIEKNMRMLRHQMLVKTAGALLLATGLVLAVGCKNDPPTAPPPPRQQVKVPAFSADSAYAYVAKQVEFGPRVVNSPGHKACREWLVGTFKRFGAKVIEQEFKAKAYTGETLNGVNIIAQYNPEKTQRVVLAAHWDTRHIADSPLSAERKNEPILGADDAGSGVGVLLEIARQLQANPIDIGVDIVLFDAEDYGDSEKDNPESWGLGSQYWSRNVHTAAKPEYGILLDMVGAKNARFPVEGVSYNFAPQLVEQVWQLARQMGFGNYYVLENGGAVTDDHYFVNTIARIPMIDIINLPVNSGNGRFGDHWHTHNDDMDIIDPRTLRAAGQVVLAVLYREAGGLF